MRSTKIICTLGPACITEEKILELVHAGMNVGRLNLSHGTWEQHKKIVHILKHINQTLSKSKRLPTGIGILLDTMGAEVRTGMVEKPLQIVEGEEVVFSSHPLPREKRQVIIVNYEHFSKDVRQAERILIDNGTLSFDLVKSQKDGSVIAKACESGSIGSRRHVNLPGADLSFPTVTEKDWKDIQHAIDENADFLALSFIRRAEEIEEVRSFIHKQGKDIQLIAKIETRPAIHNMKSIIRAADAVMVARGDLGAEVDFASIPVLQDQLVALSREAGKPVIVATHMLESMVQNPTPTRAEVTDIAHAVTTSTDATMLSSETAVGKYPLRSVEAMTRVIVATEKHLVALRKMEDAQTRDDKEAHAKAAVTLAITANADAIMVMGRTGETARDISRFRPTIPIIAVTPQPDVQRKLQLSYGVIPLLVPFNDDDPEDNVARALSIVKTRGLLKTGERCVLVSDARAHELTVSSIQPRTIR